LKNIRHISKSLILKDTGGWKILDLPFKKNMDSDDFSDVSYVIFNVVRLDI
jgi:hypothetical protein